MASFISLLRGINVSGQKKINMKELKSLYESIGFLNVSSYIQSGNLVFTSEEQNKLELQTKIQQAIANHYGFEVPVLVLSSENISSALKGLPFTSLTPELNGSQTLFSFLSNRVEEESLELFLPYLSPSENLHINKNIVYLHCPDGYGKTKVTNNLVEKKLNVTATTRNWKTVLKIESMFKDII